MSLHNLNAECAWSVTFIVDFFLFYMRGSAMTYYILFSGGPQEKKADNAIEER